jgi:diguanylate cyclase (GGDEF)-like protein
MLGVALYAVICLGLVQYGYLRVTAPAFNFLLGVWAVGLLGLLLADETTGRFDPGNLTLTKAVWCNVGVVATALLVPHPVRLLLLVVPLFGILYTALHLQRQQMFMVSAVTLFSYLLGASLISRLGSANFQFEVFLALAFTAMVVAMAFMAAEVTALRAAFARRRDALNAAMERLADLAMRDELTGLYNRRYIMEVLARQKALADRGHIGFTLCYCDLDHFKQINDRYGHQMGDKVLMDFARVAQSVVRSADFVARLGGEEFLLVLVGTDVHTAKGVAFRLCERTKFLAVIPDDPDFRTTVSVGIAGFSAGERVEDVIQRADRALYSAKSAGRDRIILGE